MDRTARIYTVFTMADLSGSSQTYPLHHPDASIVKNEDILRELRERCPDVEFFGSPRIETPEYTVANLAAQRQSVDGVLHFGPVPAPLFDLGLPIVAVHPLWAQWQEPFDGYVGKRVLTAVLPIIPDASSEVFSSRLDRIAGKVRLMQTAAHLKKLRILAITDRPPLGEYEPTRFQTAAEGRDLYERNYLANLADLGPELVVRPQTELIETMEQAVDREVREVADRWVSEAEEVKGTTEKEIRKSAALYLAMRDMMCEYGATAVTTEGYGVFMNYPGGPIPSQGLPSSQFCTDGVVATSETLFDSLLTQQIGRWTTGATGFNGDYIVDPDIGKAYIGHCECPWDPYGDERRVPFVIRNLPQYPVDQQEIGGACVHVKLPDDEPVTVAKWSVHDKKLALFEGNTVSGDSLFNGWSDILCRTKLAIDTDAAALMHNLDWVTFGNHRVAFYGTHRKTFEDLATLLGYESLHKDTLA